MTEYQPKRSKFYLAPTLYQRTVATIRDYPRLKSEYLNILLASPAPQNGMPSGTSVSSPIERAAEAADTIQKDISAIERALLCVPAEYRSAEIKWICNGAWPPDVPANKNTKTKWKQIFIYNTAKNLGLFRK